MQFWYLSLLVEIQHLDSHTLWPVMSMLPVVSLVLPLCSGCDLATLPPSLLVETSLWGLHHPTLSPSTHCASPTLDSIPARLLLEVTLGQPQSWWRIFQVGNWAHCTSLSLIGCFKIWSNRKMTGKCVSLFFEIGSTVHNSNSQLLASYYYCLQAQHSLRLILHKIYWSDMFMHIRSPNLTCLKFQFWGVRQAGSWGVKWGSVNMLHTS